MWFVSSAQKKVKRQCCGFVSLQTNKQTHWCTQQYANVNSSNSSLGGKTIITKLSNSFSGDECSWQSYWIQSISLSCSDVFSWKPPSARIYGKHQSATQLWSRTCNRMSNVVSQDPRPNTEWNLWWKTSRFWPENSFLALTLALAFSIIKTSSNGHSLLYILCLSTKPAFDLLSLGKGMKNDQQSSSSVAP